MSQGAGGATALQSFNWNLERSEVVKVLVNRKGAQASAAELTPMGIQRKTSAAKRKPADFGAALAKARQETDHIFKRASEDEKNSTTGNEFLPSDNTSSSIRPDEKISPRSKAAAWAWYQHGGGNNGSSNNPEEVRNRALVVVKRTSRFKAEALRVNGSYTAEDTLIKAEHKWDPNQSLFDSFELLAVAKELDKALKEAASSSSSSSSSSAAPPSSSSACIGGGSGSGSSSSNLVSLNCSSPSFGMGRKQLSSRLSRMIPAPVMCLSEEDIATKRSFGKKSSSSSSRSSNNTSNMKKRTNSIGSGAFEKLSKAIHLLTYTPPASLEGVVDKPDKSAAAKKEGERGLHHHRHEHFHHHLHHHHHHVAG